MESIRIVPERPDIIPVTPGTERIVAYNREAAAIAREKLLAEEAAQLLIQKAREDQAYNLTANIRPFRDARITALRTI